MAQHLFAIFQEHIVIKRDVSLDSLNSLFITLITLFLPLYNIVLIFIHRTENNGKLQLKSLIGH